jgi:hypothetical protein
VVAAAAPGRAEARAGALTRADGSRDGVALSAVPETRERPGEVVAGLLAALAIFASLIGVAYRPGRLIPAALLLALLATAIGGRHARLASLAILVGGVCFVVGMALAVITNHPLY